MTYYRSHFDPEIEAKSQAYVEQNKNTIKTSEHFLGTTFGRFWRANYSS